MNIHLPSLFAISFAFFALLISSAQAVEFSRLRTLLNESTQYLTAIHLEYSPLQRANNERTAALDVIDPNGLATLNWVYRIQMEHFRRIRQADQRKVIARFNPPILEPQATYTILIAAFTFMEAEAQKQIRQSDEKNSIHVYRLIARDIAYLRGIFSSLPTEKLSLEEISLLGRFIYSYHKIFPCYGSVDKRNWKVFELSTLKVLGIRRIDSPVAEAENITGDLKDLLVHLASQLRDTEFYKNGIIASRSAPHLSLLSIERALLKYGYFSQAEAEYQELMIHLLSEKVQSHVTNFPNDIRSERIQRYLNLVGEVSLNSFERTLEDHYQIHSLGAELSSTVKYFPNSQTQLDTIMTGEQVEERYELAELASPEWFNYYRSVAIELKNAKVKIP